MTRGRRDVLATAGGLLTATAAGCLDEPNRVGEADGSLYASFFVLEEFADAVADERRVENAVPEGEHGHGWNPSTSLVPEIVDADAFVYLGAEGFQHWVDDALPELESDYSDDVVLIDALEGIDLLEYDGDGHDHDDGYDSDAYDLSVASVHLFDRDGDELADAHGDHWHGHPLAIPREADRSITVDVRDERGETIALGEAYQLAVRVVDGDADLIDADTDTADADRIDLVGRDDGFVELAVQLVSDDDVVYETPPLKTEVGNHSHDHDDHDHSQRDDHGHSHGEYDAKFFSDPVLARRGVETIRDELIALDPDNEAVYEENAAAYIQELESLHRSYEERLADRDHDAVVLAGHDSFRYLSNRYGFEIHTPVGLSPDSEPASDAIADTVDFVEERGIEYVLWDYFDGDRLATTIADAAETVEGTLMVSPAESTTEAWLEDGYGDYLGQMAEINLPVFEKALGAE
ncbi:metal ion ABC transporter substrate-binding protein [Natronococcus pandeyae]|uniref:Metal ion ABC transporter substrate-binding protein n=1 Tax=Natronococcus pandeyae TaxID=2055836 RepID=A0A8J8TU50_9EURY|nr:zinc ABC transporter substrate-binding protein [Natronococcus pandeyae]TYL40644.1 metal ion ABC transporter substrate-binding protein [Natronococcus pandeyae]